MTRASDLAKLLGAGATILDGTTISTADNDPQLILTSTDADGNEGPVLKLLRNSASPADDDNGGRVQFTGKNDAAQDVEYGRVRFNIQDATDGTEDGQMDIATMINGSLQNRINITSSEFVLNEGSIDSDFRVESNGNANMLFVDGGNDRIGIGTTSPASLLDIRSSDPTLLVRGTSGSGVHNAEINFSNSVGTVVGELGVHYIGGATNFYRNVPTSWNHVWKVNDSEKMRIDSSGRVMIGTTTAGESTGDDLTIATTGATGITVRSGTSSDGHLFFSDGTSGGDQYRGYLQYNHQNDRLNFGTNGVERMRILSNGALQVKVGGAGYTTWGGADTSAQINSVLNETVLTAYSTLSSFTNDVMRLLSLRGGSSSFDFLVTTSGEFADDQHKLRGDGNAYADGSWNGGGADYAEYFEWADRNTDNEDRRGYTVVLDNNKIRKATSDDDASIIIGAISGNPSMVGDSDVSQWKGKYQRDDYGTYVLDKNGDRVLNTNYDETQEYVSRENRQEWDTVGLMGKLRIRKNQPTGSNWIKMRNVSETVEEWLVR